MLVQGSLSRTVEGSVRTLAKCFSIRYSSGSPARHAACRLFNRVMGGQTSKDSWTVETSHQTSTSADPTEPGQGGAGEMTEYVEAVAGKASEFGDNE